MYTKEDLLDSCSKGRTGKIKGVLSLKEAKEAFELKKNRFGRSSLTTLVSSGNGRFFFSDDHCFGTGVLDEFVPVTTQIPMSVTPRECLPSGLVDSVETYLLIFHKNMQNIETIEELLTIINKE